MKIKSIKLTNFKRFTDLTIEGLPETAKLVVMIGPNGSGKSSVFEALDFYIYIIKNNAYPFDDTFVDLYDPMHMLNYYLKNDQPDPYVHMSPEDVASRGMEVGKAILADCVNITLHYAQEMEANELKVHTRSSSRSYSLLFSSDLLSSLSVEKLQLKLRRLPTEKAIDHMYALNHWMLFMYEMVHQASMAVLSRDSQLPLPQELKQYAETVSSFKDKILEKTINAMTRLFTDPKSALMLKKRLQFNLEKGINSSGSYLNPSTGEIAVLDLLLDIVIKRVVDDETVICIDEPELHIHTKLQGQLLEGLYNLISPKSQLWIATHSVGMVRKAQELYQKYPNSVVFLDFRKDHSGKDHDFDGPVTIKPVKPNPNFWALTYEVALGDLAELVTPQRIILCESKAQDPTKAFDAACYNQIFGSRYPDTRFISIGGEKDVAKADTHLIPVIEAIAAGVEILRLRDRDRATKQDIIDNAKKGIRILSRKYIEKYLTDNEVLAQLCVSREKPDKVEEFLAAKDREIEQVMNNDKIHDKRRPIVQRIQQQAEKILGLSHSGDTTESFMRDILAPLIQPSMKVYEELHKDIFGE
ncbi:MAG: AAA family ATPase [Candidatus Poribacteria bacterium]|nr:AAA family ATPase [Candidatus Poribacteria bacterium]